MKRIEQKGFSLIELAIGLAVVSVLILAVSVSSGIQDNARVQSAANSVRSLHLAAENYLVSGKVNYTGVSVDALKVASFLPNNFNASGSNPWGGNYSLVPSNDNSHVEVSLSGVKAQDAVKLSAYFASSSSQTVFDSSAGVWTATF